MMQTKLSKVIILIVSLGTIFSCESQKATEANKAHKKSTTTKKETNMNLDTATFGAGCFWCVEAIFQRLKGVDTVVSGYSGGKIANPTYREVSSGLTGHAEVIQITYNPSIISFEQLTEVFFYTHDPTTLNRQGADEGTQYRSAIFYHNEEQKNIAEKIKNKLNSENTFGKPIVTEISVFNKFFPAEDYHQNYYNQNGQQPYCRIVILPKVGKLTDKFKHLLKE
jgi:peptide-methionine (S)-S-oxide reductase